MSTASRRSSSVSSASSSGNSTSPKSSKSNANGVKKKFACSHDGCGKSFSRSEHLHRHALNHKDGNNTCLRCSAHFRRRDLLDRHMARHKEKDDEAGGEGLGFLATRKRLWRDSDGKIVNCRRPHTQEHQSKRRQVGGSPETGRRRRSSATSAGTAVEKENPIAAPLSPPVSIPSTASASGAAAYTHSEQVNERIGGGNDGILDDGPMLHEVWNVDPMLSATSSAVDDFDFLCNSGWGSQPPVNSFETFMGSGGELQPYDDLFRPDTAASFNAPFTTMSYYSWLFDKDSDDLPTNEPQQLQKSSTNPSSHKSAASLSEDRNANSSNMPVTPNHDFQELDILNNELGSPSDEVPAILASMHMQTETNGLFRPPTKELGFYSSHIYPKSNGYYQTVSTPSPGRSTLASTFNDERSEYGAQNTQIPLNSEHLKSSQPMNSTAAQITHVQLPPDAHQAREPTRLPKITHEARKGLMHLIDQARPCKPNGNLIMLYDPLLSISSLQHYSDLFFTRFNSSYPLIHRPTFDPENVHPFLLMAILLLGATYSDKEAHLLAVCIHDIMRPLIHSSKEFSTKPNLWLLQTILLVECFGKSRAGEKQHDMSHLYHGLLINLIRRSDCQSACIAPFNQRIHNLEDYWREAVIAEQKRRLAMLCFMWDTQHAVLFSQSLCMNASELHLTLPWDPSIWEAPTALEWHHHLSSRSTPFPTYLSVLRSYTNPNSPDTNLPTQLTNLNALSRVLILHGLMSLAWDLNRRDQTSLGLGLSSLKSSNTSTSATTPLTDQKEIPTWQHRISQSYNAWKSDFETYTATVLAALKAQHDSTRHEKFKRFSVANIAIYHTAQMILAVDIVDLQIFAGARHIIGRAVTGGDRERSRRRVGEWLGTGGGEKRKNSAKAVWHAARLFRDGVTKLENWSVDDMFHYPWCLYLATLMCWVFHEAATTKPVGISRDSLGGRIISHHHHHATRPGTAEEDPDFDSRAEMNALISNMTKFGEPSDSDTNGKEWVDEIWEAAGKYRTGGLLRCMVKQLNSVRWAVVREGMIVLRGLVEG